MRHCSKCKKEYEVSSYSGYCSYACRKAAGVRTPGIQGCADTSTPGVEVSAHQCQGCAEWEKKYERLLKAAEGNVEIAQRKISRLEAEVKRLQQPIQGVSIHWDKLDIHPETPGREVVSTD